MRLMGHASITEKCRDKDNQKERDRMGVLSADQRIMLEDGKAWTGFIWLRIETNSGLL